MLIINIQSSLNYCRTPVLGLGLGVDFIFAWDLILLYIKMEFMCGMRVKGRLKIKKLDFLKKSSRFPWCSQKLSHPSYFKISKGSFSYWKMSFLGSQSPQCKIFGRITLVYQNIVEQVPINSSFLLFSQKLFICLICIGCLFFSKF